MKPIVGKYRTRNGKAVIIDNISTNQRESHPVSGRVLFKYPGVSESKENWTASGKILANTDEENPFDLVKV